MPSFTSNSEAPDGTPSGIDGRWVTRDIPEQPWYLLLAVVLCAVAMGTAGWEVYARSLGYGPSLDDTPNLWAPQRARAVGARRDQVVFVGDSRTLFDMDLAVFRNEIGGPEPIQLATVGSNPLIILEDLAKDTSFAGTAMVGLVPGLAAAAAGPPVANPTRFVTHYHHWTMANRMELPLVIWLNERLAFLNEDLTLARLIETKLPLPERPSVFSPRLPPYMYTLDRNRQARMTEAVATNGALQHQIQQGWLPLFRGPPRPAVFTPEQWGKMLSDGWESNLRRFKQSVASIQARGGRVIFSRPPSSGELYALERKNTPNAAFWDRVLAETGAPGINFEDHAELQGFDCPEWSHLNARDATEYTKRFARILKAQALF
ncbi:MAG: hypothetical protein ABI036_02360 [Fibrobacteria bacterium]